MNQSAIVEILEKQLSFLKQNAYKSYDLCDITSRPYFLRMNKLCQGLSYGKYIKYPHNLLLENFAPALRKLYGVKKNDFAQSNAFVIRGLLRLFQNTKNEEYLTEAEALIERVIQQKSKGFKHSCWGQPYDWFSQQIIPAYTPRTTVTSQVGKMFLDAYGTTKKQSFLDMAIEIGNFFIEEMPLSYDRDNQTCFAYTTIDKRKVHNPNMMASGFLSTLWKTTGENRFLERSISAANFTFSNINPDGSWFYDTLPDNKPSKIDNYHTGYNLEGSVLLKKNLGDQFSYQTQLEKAISYYENKLFDNQGIPRLTDKKKFPIDIQCCAQSVITFAHLSEIDTKYWNQAENLFKWTVEHMFDSGSYYYRIFKNGSKDRTDYIRWGDAWMFFAGSMLLTR
ncbi:hypothetical protein SAMN05421640_3540 [Ekhidna lutea]|uniref:Delta-aminolevulinic acid dehydratase n=1 Tax=Ekhidna lutea TaxID=447679 RepID=A0A239M2A1_EKHLU|nr:hypothetical protein [Ekhidna lutea]SNT36074.1 hypothetical protein SAMN05421640_3540 [Ekhidna lutea]